MNRVHKPDHDITVTALFQCRCVYIRRDIRYEYYHEGHEVHEEERIENRRNPQAETRYSSCGVTNIIGFQSSYV